MRTPGMRWMQPETYHVTLHFCGEVAMELVEPLRTVLSSVSVPSFSLSIQRLGCFVRNGSQGVLWAGLSSSETLQILHGRVGEAVEGVLGTHPSSGVYRPHVTLARQRMADVQSLRRFIARNSDRVSTVFPVKDFVLVRSDLRPLGPVYTVLDRFPLA